MKHIHFTPKILLAALTMLLMSHPLSSQAQFPPSTWLQSPYQNARYDGVVRIASPTEIVSSHTYASGSLFTKVNNVGQITQRRIKNIKVHDFQIDNGYVIFCGENELGNAVIGSFGVADINNSSSPISTNEQVFTTLTGFSRLEVYRLTSRQEVHAVMLQGHEPGYYPVYDSNIVECDYDYTSGACSAIKAGVAFRTRNPFIYATDIVVTDTNVIVLGAVGTTGIMMKRCAKSSVFASPQANTIYEYNLANEPNLQCVIGTYMGNGIFATVNPSGGGGSTWKMHVREFDVATMKMLHSQYIDLEEKTNPLSLQYLKDVDSLVVLQRHAYVAAYGTGTDIVSFKPFAATDYTAPIIWPTRQSQMGRMCRRDGHSVVAVDLEREFWFYRDYALNTPSGCRFNVPVLCHIEPTCVLKTTPTTMAYTIPSIRSIALPLEFQFDTTVTYCP